MNMHSNGDELLEDFIRPEGSSLDEPTPNRCRTRRSPVIPPNIEEMRRMFQAIEKCTYIWKKRRGGPNQPSISDWESIAEKTTGNPDDVAKVKDWYQKSKRAIRYRVRDAVSSGLIRRERLETDADGRDALEALYKYKSYPYWPEVEYLTKHFICLECNIDTESPAETDEPVFYDHDQMPSLDETAAVQSAPVGYNDLLSGVPGYNRTVPWQQLDPVPRVSQLLFPQVEETDQVNSSQIFQQQQPSSSEQFFGNYQDQGQRDNITNPLTEVKHEVFDTEMGDQPEGNFHDTRTLDNEGVTVDQVKQEFNEDDSLEEDYSFYTHPLKHLDPTNKQNHLPPQPEWFHITQEEMDKRIQMYEKFQQYLKDKLEPSSLEEIIKFYRSFNKIGSYVSAIGSSSEFTPDRIIANLENL